jgi:hypothetical protein
MDAFEEQMREHAPPWSAFNIRIKFQGYQVSRIYLENGFAAKPGDVETLSDLIGHSPR